MKKMKKMKKMISAVLSLSTLITMMGASPYAEAAGTYFDGTVKIAKFGGSITAPGGSEHWTQLTAQYIADTYGNGSYEMSNYAVGGIGSTTGLTNLVQAFNTTGTDRTDNPDVVFIEYAVNDSGAVKVSYTKKDVTAETATVIAYDNEKNDINIYNSETNTYEFDYYNTLEPTDEFVAGKVYPSGHYSIGLSQDTLRESKLRIEEMVRLARELPSKPAVFLVNVGLGLTLGAGHTTRPNFPGVANSIAKEYNKLAEEMGIGYIDVQDATWKYMEAAIGERMAEDDSKTRDEVRSELQLELYGDESSIHPTSAGSAVYAEAIKKAIDAAPEKFLTYTSDVTYTTTESYGENTHIIPYTAGEYTGNWGLTKSSSVPFSYGMSTSAEGDTVKYNFTGPMLGIIADGGYYSYSIYDNTANEEIYTSSPYAKGRYIWDENNKVGTSGKTLVKDHNYTLTLTKGSDGASTTVYGAMANMTMEAGAAANGGNTAYTSYSEYNASLYIGYNEQYYNFTNKETAADTSIETYFADISELSYEGTISRVEDRDALKLSAAADAADESAYISINLGDDAALKILNIEFDVKYDSTQYSEFFVGDVQTQKIVKMFRILINNPASPCINTGSNRFNTDINDWWKENCNDGEYHRIRVQITPMDTLHNIRLYIDGVKGDTEFLVSNALNLNTLKLGLTMANSEVYIDDIRIYDEISEVRSKISALGEITVDKEAEINEIRERADYIYAQNGTYAQITNYQELVDAEAELLNLKEIQANVSLRPSSVYSPFVGSSIAYDFNSSYEVSQVILNGSAVEYMANDGRLMLDKSLFTEAGAYNLSVKFTDGSIFYTENVNLEIYGTDSMIIKTAELTLSDYEAAPGTISYTDNNSTANWCFVSNKGWNGWSELGTEPYFLRMNTTQSITEGANYFTFKNLPSGKYTVEYAMYGGITQKRVPLIDVASGNTTLKGIDPYSSAQTGYVSLGEFNFLNDNTLKVMASSTQRSANDSSAIMCVYGIKLTPIIISESVIETYIRTGKSIIDLINSAADAAELRAITEMNAEYLGIDKNALDVMTSIYEKLFNEKPENGYGSCELYKEAFEAAVMSAMVSKTVTAVQTLEDLREKDSSGFYLRNAASFMLNSADVTDRPAYAYYNLDLKNLKTLEVVFETANNHKRVITVDASLTALPVTTSYNNLTSGDDFDKLVSFTANYTSEFTQSVTTEAQEGVTQYFTIDLSELVARAIAADMHDLTLKFRIDGNGGVDNVTLKAYYDETGTKPLEVYEHYTVDKVSFVNVTASEQGYIGSAYVTKNTDIAADAKLIAAAYTSDGTLLNVKFVDITGLEAGKSTKLGINEYTAYEPGYVKIFVWQDFLSMVPCSINFTINAPTNRDDGDYSGAWYFPNGTFVENPKN